jgi:hypothetical protein
MSAATATVCLLPVGPHRAVFASPELVYRAELDLACTYAMRCPELAKECAQTAVEAAIALGRPDWTYRANALLAAIGGAS